MDRHYVTFDELSFPLDGEGVTVEGPDDSPIEGAGIHWTHIEGQECVTVAITIRGQDPLHLSVVEDEDGGMMIVLPELKLHRQPTSE